MNERRVTVLDPTLQKLAQSIQAQLIRVLNENCDNVKTAVMKELKPIDVSPHIVRCSFLSPVISLYFVIDNS